MKSLKISIAFVIAIFLLIISPYVIFGENNYITAHDNLENMLPQFVQAKTFGFFSLDKPCGAMDNMSCAYVGWGGFTIQNVLYYVLPPYTAFVVMYIISILIGFISMYFLQKIIFGNESKHIYIVTSLLYAILPLTPNWSIACAAIPLTALNFIQLYRTKDPKWLIVTFFLPFLLEFQCDGLYICGLWILGCFFVCIKDKKFNKILFWGSVILIIATILFNLRMFYMKFVLNEPMNPRLVGDSFIFSNFWATFKSYFIDGYYHAASLQKKLLLPFLFAILAFIAYPFAHGEKIWKEKPIQIILYCLLCIVVFNAIAALDETHAFDIIKNLTPLKGYQFQRFFVFSRMIWYILFSALLMLLSNTKVKYIIPVILCLQTVEILTAHTPYNDSLRSLYYNIRPSAAHDYNVTWKEFYDEELFNSIKQEIDYQNEPVVAVGYHPFVLMFNKFNCIDGYLSYYPYKDFAKFRKLIAPELEQNEIWRTYYDNWGGRKYVCCSDISDDPSRTKMHEPITLRIDTNVFINDFGGKYILSRAAIQNAENIGLVLVGSYTHPHSIYIIHVYKVNASSNKSIAECPITII